MSDMRTRNNALAEKLWYITQECVDRGVSIEDFRRECAECWVEVHLDRARDVRPQFFKELR